MATSKMSATLKGKHHKHACLTPAKPSSKWTGMPNRDCPEVARQHEPSGAEPVRQQYSNAVSGEVERIPNPLAGPSYGSNRVEARPGSIKSPKDLRAKSHNHHGPAKPFES